MNIGLPVILPSEDYLIHLSKVPNYWFGSGLYKDTASTCEWYNEYYDRFAVYIDDFTEIPDALNTIKENKGRDSCYNERMCKRAPRENPKSVEATL